MRIGPVNRQFGSKWRIADELLAMVPRGMGTWVELFAGTAAMTLLKPRTWHKDEHLNDLNRDIVNLFAVLRDARMRDELCDLIDLTPWARAEWDFCRHNPHPEDPVERARRYLVRCWQGMGGTLRKGTGWVAVDRSSKRRPAVFLSLPERIRAVAERLRGTMVHEENSLDFFARFENDPDAFVFIDPPYPTSAIATDRAYAVEMSDDEHAALAQRCARARCSVMVTMVPGTIYETALKDLRQRRVMVRGMKHAVKPEIVFTNYPPPRDLLTVRA